MVHVHTPPYKNIHNIIHKNTENYTHTLKLTLEFRVYGKVLVT